MKPLGLAALAVLAPWLVIAAIWFHNSNPPVAYVCTVATVFIVMFLATETYNGNAS